MTVFVVDASAALAWCFEDEASSFTDGLLDRLRHGDQIVVPAHWPTEISNALLVALRKKRIKAGQPELFWDELARLPVEIEPPLTAPQAKTVLALGGSCRTLASRAGIHSRQFGNSCDALARFRKISKRDKKRLLGVHDGSRQIKGRILCIFF